ncbi:hypothetical protein MesoLjLc_43180 [Mesorhizobium sp. L-8-10]|uniref:DUF2059 domain-containing protein n=1 Tax=unclassified Mesorhizobium TaxID=325217 RepID=UPI0019267843|nr:MULTISPECIES: DUF2059 domain-containing protein [unclassified Mesorhizobium]BCH24651.1 hypothetical protein MesoLjLb_44360 [Mesorhizobium sp. L-8-3]BCH32388.1 hypothetical protein MesoLjLc_43180 [Mesorhizobium sp. L-8-10]
MTLADRARCLSVAFVSAAVLACALPAAAQDISESHLKAARAAVDSINVTDQFDSILPQAAAALKAELIQKNPDRQQLILQTVDEKTLWLAGRRADLEKEAAMAYARTFSEEDLNTISTFYNSGAGKKLLADGAIVMRQVMQAAEIWQRGVARDLAQSVGEVLSKAPGAQAQPLSPAPEAQAAPAQNNAN